MKENWKETMKKGMIVLGVLLVAVAGGLVLYFRWNAKTASEKVEEKADQGQDFMDEGYYRDALAYLEEASEDGIENEKVELAIAECYFMLGEDAAFKEKADEIAETYGIDNMLYQFLGYYYGNQQDYYNQIAIWKQGVQDYPEDGMLKNLYDSAKGKYTEAGMLVEEVIGSVDGYTIVRTDEGVQIWNAGLNRVGNESYDEVYDLSTDACISPRIDGATLLYAARKGDTVAYYDQNGYLRLSPKNTYSYLGVFRDGYALVQSDQGWGYIDMDFNECSGWYEDATSFTDGFAAVKKDGVWTFINTEFEPIVDSAYTDVMVDGFHRCYVGGAAFAQKDGKYVMVTKEGEQEGSYEQVKPFLEEDGYAACYRDGGWTLVSREGQTIPITGADEITSSSNDIIVYRSGDAYGYFDIWEGVYTDPIFTEAGCVNVKGYAPVQKDDGWSFIHFEKFNINDGIL